MIKIKYKIENGKIIAVWEDRTGVIINYINEDSIKDAYIICSNETNRSLKFEEIPEDFIKFEPNPTATTLKVTNWAELQAKVYDQYGAEMEVIPTFTIEGEHARIEDNKIIEDVVDTDTSYFIIAKVGELEERRERVIYAPVVPVSNPYDMALAEMSMVQAAFMADTNKAIGEMSVILGTVMGG